MRALASRIGMRRAKHALCFAQFAQLGLHAGVRVDEHLGALGDAHFELIVDALQLDPCGPPLLQSAASQP